MADYGIGSWPFRAARIRPAAVALRQGERALTYKALAGRADALAGALAARGVRAGDRVAYLGFNDIAAFEVFFAAGRLGALFVPLNTRLTAGEISLLLDDAAPSVLFHGAEHRELAEKAAEGSVWVAGPEERESLTEGDAMPPEAEITLGDDAVILYTSGTTGRPKGAVLTHGNLTFNTMNQLAHVDILHSDTALCVAPLFHAAGLGQVSLPTLFKGGTVMVVPKFDAGAVLTAIAEHRIASFAGVPTMLQMLCDHPAFVSTDLSSLRYVIYGGSMASERVARSWQQRGVPVLQGYGMTEASPGVTLAVADEAVRRPVSAGVAHFFTDLTIRRPSPDGSGELLVGGLNVFRGYWKRPADTAAVMEGRWLRSGDVVRFDEDDWLYAIDRIKDVIISGGENVYPAEVEAHLDALPSVAESAVVGVPDTTWGEVGVAYVVVSGPGQVTEEGLRQALRGRMAAFKVPKHVRLVDRLPRNATGKVMKTALRERRRDSPPVRP